MLSGVGKWVDLELHFNVDLIHLITAEGCIEMLCYSSFSVYLLSLLCLRISVFPLFDGLRVLIEKAKMLKNFKCPWEGYRKLCSGKEMQATCRRASF